MDRVAQELARNTEVAILIASLHSFMLNADVIRLPLWCRQVGCRHVVTHCTGRYESYDLGFGLCDAHTREWDAVRGDGRSSQELPDAWIRRRLELLLKNEAPR